MTSRTHCTAFAESVSSPQAKGRPQKKDGGKQNGCISTATSTPAHPPSNGEPPTGPDPPRPASASAPPSSAPSEETWPSRERAQTLSELKKQRAAAKLLNHPLLNGHLGNGSAGSLDSSLGGGSSTGGGSSAAGAGGNGNSPEDSRMPLVSSNGNAVYFTPASGDPPLLKFKQPIEEEQVKGHSCCCIS